MRSARSRGAGAISTLSSKRVMRPLRSVGHPADADVGPQSVAVLHLHGHARHLANDPLDVRMAEAPQLLNANVMGTARDAVGLRPLAQRSTPPQ